MAAASPRPVPRRDRPPPERPADRAPPVASPPPERDGSAPLTPEQARLLPFYHDLRNEIVEPDKVVVSTQYFWTRWAPRLGPTLTALVVCLRRHCYYNRATQERRDWCFPEQATLAREIGVESTKTIRAALRHPLARHFVRREARYVYDPGRGKKVRTSDMYYVAMDDPLTPDDEARLALLAAARLLAEGRGAELSSAPGPLAPPTGQKGPQVGPRAPEGGKGREVGAPTGRSYPQDSAPLFAPEVVLEDSTNTTKYSMESSRVDPWHAAIAAFAAANAGPPTPAQQARLAALAAEFDAVARRGTPPSTGAAWVLAAIHEAVESGSRFVAPRRVARICARWAAEGLPPDALTTPGDDLAGLSDAAASRGARSSPLRGEGGSDGTADALPEDVVQSPLPGERGLAVGLSEEDRGSGDINRAPVLSGEARAGVGSLNGSFVVYPGLDLLSRPFWQAVCADAAARLPSPGDRKLLEGSQLLGRDGDALVVGVPGRSAARRAELRLAPVLASAARSILRRAVDLRFVSLAEWPEA